MLSENFRVICKILQTNGVETDISDYIREIIIVHSINLSISEVTLILTRNVMDLIKTEIQEVDLEIRTHKFEKFPRHTDKYKLIPLVYRTNLYSPVLSPITSESLGTENRDFLQFYIKPCYNAATYTIQPILKFFTTVEEILNTIKPPQTEYVIDSDLNSRVISQIYLRRQPFSSAIQQLAFYFGLSPGPVVRSIVPDSQNPNRALILLSDVHQVMTEAEQFDKSFVIRVPNQNMMKKILEELGQDTFVADFSVEFSQEILPYINYNIITKPYKKLYTKQSFSITDIINNFGAVYLHYDRKIENCSGQNIPTIRNIIDHSCFDEDIQCVTSMLAHEYMFNVRGTLRLEEIPNFNCIWPGEIARIIVPTPDATIHSGLYVVESTIYRLTREKSRTWQQSCEISIIRSNLIYQTRKVPSKTKTKDVTINLDNYNIKDQSSKIQSSYNTLKQQISGISHNLNEIQTLSTNSHNITTILQSTSADISLKKDSVNTELQGIQQETDVNNVLSRLSNVESYTNELQTLYNNYESETTNLQDSFTQLKDNFQQISNINTDLFANARNAVESFNKLRGDIVRKLDITDISYLSDYIQNSIKSISSCSKNVDKIIQLSKYFQDETEKIEQAANSTINKIQTYLNTLDEILQEIDYINNNGPYTNDDLQWLKSYINRKITSRFAQIQNLSLHTQSSDVLNIINEKFNDLQNIHSEIKKQTSEYIHYNDEKLNVLVKVLENMRTQA